MQGRGYGYGGGMGMTPMVQRLLIANGLVFLAQNVWPLLNTVGPISPAAFFRGMIWQPFTYMWLHAGLFHLFMNMFVLWMFGGTLESVWGSKRFLRFYLTCGVGAGFVILIWNSLMRMYFIPTLGASGAIFGLLMAFSLMWPDRTIMLLFPPMPVKAIWFIPLLFVMQFALDGGRSNISYSGHLGGVLVAAVLLRKEFHSTFSFSSLRFRWHRWRMRRRLRAVRHDEWSRRRKPRDDDDPPSRIH
ncbi:MAG: rhomboid family intramembrane serine protease [Myxococcota bacterium]